MGDAGHGGRPQVQGVPVASLGLHAQEVHEPDDLGGAWSKAFAADRPTVLDVHTDPDFPPIPPHATFEQAKATARRCSPGDEDALGVRRSGVKQKVQEFIPSAKAKR